MAAVLTGIRRLRLTVAWISIFSYGPNMYSSSAKDLSCPIPAIQTTQTPLRRAAAMGSGFLNA
jgi:hypothetical protein